METCLLATGTLSSLIVIKSNYYDQNDYVHYSKDGYVLLGEESAFSTLVKIEAERATSNDRYVNLRFCNSNKYWQKNADDNFIVAVSNKPEEDTTKSSCTLFEAVEAGPNGEFFYLVHVQSGGRLLFEEPSLRFFVQPSPKPDQGYLSFVNWDELVKLPKKVAFKGYNGKYLQGVWMSWDYVDRQYLQFSTDDPNKETTGYEITLVPDRHVRIFSKYFNKYWRRDNGNQSTGWIWADSDGNSADKLSLFWPVKLDNNTIALRSEDNNKFCQAVTSDWQKVDCLDASATTTANQARLSVEELVIERKIFNVRYRMEDSRIYNETPFVAGTTTAENHSDSEAGIAVSVTYKDEKSHSFSRSTSLTAGVKTSIEAGVPLISSVSIEVGFEINSTMEWNDTTTTTTEVTATGSVPVPPGTLATVNYVGTMGTCDVPFYYTQQDRSSTDGSITETEEIDGVFRGVNAYNFSFVIEKTQSL